MGNYFFKGVNPFLFKEKKVKKGVAILSNHFQILTAKVKFVSNSGYRKMNQYYKFPLLCWKSYYN